MGKRQCHILSQRPAPPAARPSNEEQEQELRSIIIAEIRRCYKALEREVKFKRFGPSAS